MFRSDIATDFAADPLAINDCCDPGYIENRSTSKAQSEADCHHA